MRNSKQYDLEDRTLEFVKRKALIQESSELMNIFGPILRGMK